VTSKHDKKALAIFAVVVAAGALYFVFSQGNPGNSPGPVSPAPQPAPCTMEAKLCPDGSYVGRSGPACEFAACPQSSDSVKNPLKTFTDSASGISFSYPEKLSVQYISPVDWPPKVQLINEFFACHPAGNEISTAGITEKISVAGREYCRTKETEGAAGSTFTKYSYAFSDNDNTIILTFTLRFTQCDNFSGPAAVACKSERANFGIDGIVDKIAQSVKF
jgi:hypothetical protein